MLIPQKYRCSPNTVKYCSLMCSNSVIELSKLCKFIKIVNREGKVNQIKRDVCCLDIENGSMSMVNLDSYIDSRRIKFIYRIINEPIENWNAIGKYWLSRLDFILIRFI